MVRTPDVKATMSKLMTDQNSLAWMDTEVGHLENMIEDVAGPLAADGGFLNVLGIVTTVFILLLLVSAVVVSLRRPWTRVAVRVAGSWVVAVGMLMFGWLFRGAL